MESHITPERIANAIMQDTSFNGLYLIVEGKKDSKVYGKFIQKETTQIKEAFGYLKVIKVIELLSERGFQHSLGIIDSDFSSILGRDLPNLNYIITDDHDIEMTIIKTEALETVVDGLSGKEAVTAFCDASGLHLRQILFESCKELAYLKMANHIDNLGLVFKPKEPEGNHLKYKKFICDKTLRFLGREPMVDAVINYSRNKSGIMAEKTKILESIEVVSSKEYDMYHLLNGHDVCNAIFLMLKYCLKCRNPILNDFNAVEEMLTMAFDFSFFSKTNIYNSLTSWAKNKSINIIKPCYEN